MTTETNRKLKEYFGCFYCEANGTVKIFEPNLAEPIKEGESLCIGPWRLHCIELDGNVALCAVVPQCIVSRDAADPKLFAFYSTIMNDFDRRRRYYVNQRNTALKQSNDSAALHRSTGKLEALILMRQVFLDAWTRLNDTTHDE